MHRLAAALLLVGATASACAQSSNSGQLGLGTTPTDRELSTFFAIPPDGADLPAGSGTAIDGAQVYAQKCSACHGGDLHGNPAHGVSALVGGRGTIQSDEPIETVESYWPYATTVFDYIKRAMPMDMPGSLTNAQIYSVTALILFKAHIITKDAVIDARSLPKVVMPNRQGFVIMASP